jgi:hypothetical protein
MLRIRPSVAENKSIVVLPVDKAKAAVVMDIAQYEEKMRTCW